jgi:hypothetical protein
VKRLLIPIVVLGVMIGALLKLASLALIPSSSLHYKLSVDIDDNGVLRHGEGVIGVAFQSQGPLLIGNTPQWSVGAGGEAFAIDIGKRGALFVLLVGDRPRNERNHVRWGDKGRSPDAGRGALSVYFEFVVANFPNGLGSKAKIDALAASKMAVEVEAAALPLLVRFRDLNDPSSVEVVDPNNLEAAFGAGVKLVGAHAEITDEPITYGIERRLPWLKSGYREKYLVTLRSGPADNETVQNVTYGDFGVR